MAHDLCVNIDDTAPYEWRHNVGPAVRALHPSGLNLQHVYQFGVFAGNSMRQLNKMLRPHTLWGIDSFEGLPKTQQPNIHDWRAGAWAADPRNASWPHNVRWVAGWYDQLDDALVSTLGMQPAAYVDIDCDLYDSARAALDFAFRNRLIAEGTLVGYDDWHVLPCGDPAANATADAALRSGEGRAHLEMSERYLVEWRCVGGSCGCKPTPNATTMRGRSGGRHVSWGAIFRVVSIGKRVDAGYDGARRDFARRFFVSPDCAALRVGRRQFTHGVAHRFE